jgi:hypothetical protein|tara:strand:+ start:821 stop:1042 length:222 start_codon:yes stop_codon:yes gene_type:complete
MRNNELIEKILRNTIETQEAHLKLKDKEIARLAKLVEFWMCEGKKDTDVERLTSHVQSMYEKVEVLWLERYDS